MSNTDKWAGRGGRGYCVSMADTKSKPDGRCEVKTGWMTLSLIRVDDAESSPSPGVIKSRWKGGRVMIAVLNTSDQFQGLVLLYQIQAMGWWS